MPSWDEITTEIAEITKINPYDLVRKRFSKELFEYTNRNVISYYSAFLTKSGKRLSIEDADMTGFMNAVKDMDKKLGLDLLLHTPGGNPTATEAIVTYLRSVFNGDIRVIVPQIAMSAGTMIACSAKEIIMGKQSSLGPIDPQISGMAAFNIKKVFDDARADLAANPQNAHYWAIQFQKYPPSLIYDCINAIDLSSELVSKWLHTAMFADEPDGYEQAQAVVAQLNQNENSKHHGRHFDKETCRKFGMKITDLEDDDKLQDIVLSLHHAYTLLLSNMPVDKIIENHFGKAYYAIHENAPTPHK